MQHSFEKFAEACDNFEVMHQLPAPGKPCVEPNIVIIGKRLNAEDGFLYLRNTFSRGVVIDVEVYGNLGKASVGFGRLHKSVWIRTKRNLCQRRRSIGHLS